MIIVGKSTPIDNYEQYKRVINQITERIYMHTHTHSYIYIYTGKRRVSTRVWMDVSACAWQML